jgi:hypothetical protein
MTGEFGRPGEQGEDGTLNGRGGHGGQGGQGGRGGMAVVNRATWLIVALLAVVCVATGTLAFILYTDGAQPPLQFEAAELVQPVSCAGPLEYTARIRYRQAPIVIMSVRSVFNVAEQRTIIWDTAPRYTVMLIAATYEGHILMPLAAPLPEGNYELRIGVQTQTSRAAVAVMPFRCGP